MDSKVKELLEAAKRTKQNAYAPYSKFYVGAALFTDKGNLYSGCNVENTSYGLTICAERSAISQMISKGEKKISALLVVGDTDDFLPPCGACRQVMTEFTEKDTPVYMCNKHGDYHKTTVGELVPFTFFLEPENSNG